MVDVHYTCKMCDTDFTVEQGSPEPDEDIDTCWTCILVMLADDSPHGTLDDPWTREKVREARGL
jgi:hypothetical protein